MTRAIPEHDGDTNNNPGNTLPDDLTDPKLMFNVTERAIGFMIEQVKANSPFYRQEVKHTGYTTDIITDQALKWLEQRDRRKPFFLMCQHKAPHGRWEPGLRRLNTFDDVEIPEPPTLFDDYSGRSAAPANHKMGIAEHINSSGFRIKSSTRGNSSI